MNRREAIRESGRLVVLSPMGGQWTIISHPLPNSGETATTGGQLSWPWPQAREYHREARAEVALILLGVDATAAQGAAYTAIQRGARTLDEVVREGLRIAAQ